MATATKHQGSAHWVAHSAMVGPMARIGFCARGVVYGVIGVIALQIAVGGAGSTSSASKSGALREIAERSFGRGLLIVLAVGLASYALWRAIQAVAGHRAEPQDGKTAGRRAHDTIEAVIYTVAVFSTVKFISKGPAAGGTEGDHQEENLTAKLLELPAGHVLVGAAGLALMVGGSYIVYRGFAQRHDDGLDPSAIGRRLGPVINLVGTVGLVARGTVFSLIGFVLLKAAIDYDAEQANGFDGTLKLIAAQAYGGALLIVTACGLIAYGLYSFAEARYRQL